MTDPVLDHWESSRRAIETLTSESEEVVNTGYGRLVWGEPTRRDIIAATRRAIWVDLGGTHESFVRIAYEGMISLTWRTERDVKIDLPAGGLVHLALGEGFEDAEVRQAIAASARESIISVWRRSPDTTSFWMSEARLLKEGRHAIAFAHKGPKRTEDLEAGRKVILDLIGVEGV